MTRRVGNTIYFEETPPGVCEMCDEVEELRPYGPNGENICFECGMKDEETTRKMAYRHLGL